MAHDIGGATAMDHVEEILTLCFYEHPDMQLNETNEPCIPADEVVEALNTLAATTEPAATPFLKPHEIARLDLMLASNPDFKVTPAILLAFLDFPLYEPLRQETAMLREEAIQLREENATLRDHVRVMNIRSELTRSTSIKRVALIPNGGGPGFGCRVEDVDGAPEGGCRTKEMNCVETPSTSSILQATIDGVNDQPPAYHAHEQQKPEHTVQCGEGEPQDEVHVSCGQNASGMANSPKNYYIDWLCRRRLNGTALFAIAVGTAVFHILSWALLIFLATALFASPDGPTYRDRTVWSNYNALSGYGEGFLAAQTSGGVIGLSAHTGYEGGRNGKNWPPT